MRPRPDYLMDVVLALAPGRERRRWHGQGALPLWVRISEKLGEMLIAASEVQADVTSDEAGPLRRSRRRSIESWRGSTRCSSSLAA